MYKLNFGKNTKRYSEKELLDNIGKVWDYLNKQPTINDIQNYPSIVSSFATYFNRFGSWKKALETFCLYRNGEITIEENNDLKKTKRKISSKTKLEILQKYNFKCVSCGNSPANNENVKLEIDHIVPISKAGSNDLDNLQVLCKQCNIKKFNTECLFTIKK